MDGGGRVLRSMSALAIPATSPYAVPRPAFAGAAAAGRPRVRRPMPRARAAACPLAARRRCAFRASLGTSCSSRCSSRVGGFGACAAENMTPFSRATARCATSWRAPLGFGINDRRGVRRLAALDGGGRRRPRASTAKLAPLRRCRRAARAPEGEPDDRRSQRAQALSACAPDLGHRAAALRALAEGRRGLARRRRRHAHRSAARRALCRPAARGRGGREREGQGFRRPSRYAAFAQAARAGRKLDRRSGIGSSSSRTA